MAKGAYIGVSTETSSWDYELYDYKEYIGSDFCFFDFATNFYDGYFKVADSFTIGANGNISLVSPVIMKMNFTSDCYELQGKYFCRCTYNGEFVLEDADGFSGFYFLEQDSPIYEGSNGPEYENEDGISMVFCEYGVYCIEAYRSSGNSKSVARKIKKAYIGIPDIVQEGSGNFIREATLSENNVNNYFTVTGAVDMDWVTEFTIGSFNSENGCDDTMYPDT